MFSKNDSFHTFRTSSVSTSQSFVSVDHFFFHHIKNFTEKRMEKKNAAFGNRTVLSREKLKFVRRRRDGRAAKKRETTAEWK